MQLARDAMSSGDPVGAENYYQHAEHYVRIVLAAHDQLRQQYGENYRPQRPFGLDESEDDEEDEDGLDPAVAAQPSNQDDGAPEGDGEPRQPGSFQGGERPPRQDFRQNDGRQRNNGFDRDRQQGNGQHQQRRFDRDERRDRPNDRFDRQNERGERNRWDRDRQDRRRANARPSASRARSVRPKSGRPRARTCRARAETAIAALGRTGASAASSAIAVPARIGRRVRSVSRARIVRPVTSVRLRTMPARRWVFPPS